MAGVNSLHCVRRELSKRLQGWKRCTLNFANAGVRAACQDRQLPQQGSMFP